MLLKKKCHVVPRRHEYSYLMNKIMSMILPYDKQTYLLFSIINFSLFVLIFQFMNELISYVLGRGVSLLVCSVLNYIKRHFIGHKKFLV